MNSNRFSVLEIEEVGSKLTKKVSFGKKPTEFPISSACETMFKPNYSHPKIVKYLDSIGKSALHEMQFSEIDSYVDILSAIIGVSQSVIAEQIAKTEEGYFYRAPEKRRKPILSIAPIYEKKRSNRKFYRHESEN